jgi:hypothetical protein
MISLILAKTLLVAMRSMTVCLAASSGPVAKVEAVAIQSLSLDPSGDGVNDAGVWSVHCCSGSTPEGVFVAWCRNLQVAPKRHPAGVLKKRHGLLLPPPPRQSPRCLRRMISRILKVLINAHLFPRELMVLAIVSFSSQWHVSQLYLSSISGVSQD